MKKYTLLLISIFFTLNAFSQKINENKNCIYNCTEIKEQIIDSTLYDKLENGKLIFNSSLSSSKLYKVTINNDSFYYVSKPLLIKIRRSIRKAKCTDIKISSVRNNDNINIKRD